MDIRVLIADDDGMVREALSEVISREPGFELVGAASDASEAVRLALRASPHVALLDVRMPMGGGEEAAVGIHRVSPDTCLIALSAEDDASSVVSMFEHGVRTYVTKDSPPSEIFAAIRRGVELREPGNS